MRDLFHDDENRGSWKAWLRRFFLDLDSRIDFGLYQAKTWGRELYERFTEFMDRFHVAGCSTATLAVAAATTTVRRR